MRSQWLAVPSAIRARPRSTAAPLSLSAISASPSNSITAATSSLFGLVAAYAGRKLADRFGAWTGGLLGCGGYLVAVGLAAWLMPIVNEVPADFPADTLWTFRIASLGTQLTLWMVLGLTFGALSEKVFSSRSTAAAS